MKRLSSLFIIPLLAVLPAAAAPGSTPALQFAAAAQEAVTAHLPPLQVGTQLYRADKAVVRQVHKKPVLFALYVPVQDGIFQRQTELFTAALYVPFFLVAVSADTQDWADMGNPESDLWDEGLDVAIHTLGNKWPDDKELAFEQPFLYRLASKNAERNFAAGSFMLVYKQQEITPIAPAPAGADINELAYQFMQELSAPFFDAAASPARQLADIILSAQYLPTWFRQAFQKQL